MAIFADGGFKCFSCDASGQDSIKLTSMLYGLKPIEAAKKLAEDFNIPIEIGKPIDRKMIQEMQQQQQQEQEQAEHIMWLINRVYDWLCNGYKAFTAALEKASSIIDIDKTDYRFQYMVFNQSFFDRMTDKFIDADTAKQIDYALNITDYYNSEWREFTKWLHMMI
jgi:hypothetical protein